MIILTCTRDSKRRPELHQIALLCQAGINFWMDYKKPAQIIKFCQFCAACFLEAYKALDTRSSKTDQWSTSKSDRSEFLAQWEEDELCAEVVFDERFHIDNAPLQLVEKSDLLKVISGLSLPLV